ncbi:MAG: hypothetical protein BWX80_03319 [Candidatus Hydrogenedentes bacterium ADurb.Bin101]|nr:MAG: hypothetical protein BWX80_03319 [Candidatus Hydrogenedentes bacterium ADurb.Bin101]
MEGDENIRILVALCLNGIAVNAGVPLKFILFFNSHVGAAEQADLLGLVFADGGPALEGIEVIFGESFFYHERSRSGLGEIDQAALHISDLGLHHVYVACDQFQLGVVIGDTGLVGQGNPALDIQGGFLPVQGEHVIGAPVHALGQVGGLHFMVGAFIGQQPYQRGLGNQFFRHFGEHHDPGMAQVNLVLNLVYRPVVDTEQRGRLFGEIVRSVLVDQGNLAARILFHQFFRTYQVKLIVLLKNFQGARIIDGPQADRLGHDFRGNVHEPQGRFARQHLDGPAVPHQGAVVVIDRHRHIRLVFQRCLPRPQPAFHRVFQLLEFRRLRQCGNGKQAQSG